MARPSLRIKRYVGRASPFLVGNIGQRRRSRRRLAFVGLETAGGRTHGDFTAKIGFGDGLESTQRRAVGGKEHDAAVTVFFRAVGVDSDGGAAGFVEEFGLGDTGGVLAQGIAEVADGIGDEAGEGGAVGILVGEDRAGIDAIIGIEIIADDDVG